MKGRAMLRLAVLTAAGLVAAQQKAPERGVSALGRLEPEHGIIVVGASSTPEAVSGSILASLLVEEGDDVVEGQLLAVTDTAPMMEARVAEAEAELELARKEVLAARSQAEEACVRADVAQREADRRGRLHAQGITGEEEADSARGEAEARAASCTTARTAVHLYETGETVAQARLSRVKAELRRSYIRSPMDGRVIHVVARPGERIDEDGVLELGRVGRMFAVAEVYETDVRYLKEGQRATVSSPALPREVGGQVTHIRPKVEKQDEIGTDPAARKDARIVEVLIQLDDSGLVEGLTNLQVDVVIHP